jgi:glycosyltransferase involved in cell wall biosynthesis
MLRTAFKNFILWTIASVVLLPLLALAWISGFKRNTRAAKPRLIWGPQPLISLKYWSKAMKKSGYETTTFVYGVYRIHSRADFDLCIDDIVPWMQSNPLTRLVWRLTGRYYCFYRVLRFTDIVHFFFDCGFLQATPLFRLEFWLYRLAGIKTVVSAYGGDQYQYSTLHDASMRHVLLERYPVAGRDERQIREQVEFTNRQADCVIGNLMIDGVGRWDVLPFNPVSIDDSEWKMRDTYSAHDGRSGSVRVLHSPNHRCIKATEYLIQAVDELRQEGLQIELILLEGVSNKEVREKMYTADILAEQFVITGYGMSGIEGMATGIAHMCNLEDPYYTQVFKRYSYLGECPSISTDIEHIKDNLRTLVTNPELREKIGRAGRAYVEKYHSEAAANYLFSAIYDKIWFNKDVDLMNLYHPLKRPRG